MNQIFIKINTQFIPTVKHMLSKKSSVPGGPLSGSPHRAMESSEDVPEETAAFQLTAMGADQMGLRVVAGSWTGLTVEGLRCAKLLRPEVCGMFEEHKQNLSV